MTTIRKATEQDRLGLFKLAAAMHRETDFARLAFAPEKALDKLGGWLHGEGGFMCVAERDGEIVGMLAATLKAPWFSTDMIASEDLFFVRDDARGSPLAFRLMGFFVDWAISTGVAYLRAGVATGDVGKGAERIYEHFGFARVGSCYSLHVAAHGQEVPS